MTSLEQKDSSYVYFIENHIETSPSKVSISKDYMYGELLDVKNETRQINKEKYILTLYRFKIYVPKLKERGKDKLEIKIELESGGKKFPYKTLITKFDRDNYLYDVKFSDIGTIKKINPPKSIMLSHIQQFEIYKDYLEKDLKVKLKKDKRRENLVLSTNKLFQEKFTFNFYILIFLECISPEIKIKHFLNFEPKKLKGTDKKEIEKHLKVTQNFIKINKKEPEKILKVCKNEEEKDQCGMKLFAFVLYFYYEYARNEFLPEAENENAVCKKYINKALLVYNYLFTGAKLAKKKVEELIEISNTYDDLSNSLQYVNLISELLDICLSNFEKFKKLYLVEKKKDPKINIGLIITPKKEDNMREICHKYKELFEKQKDAKVMSKTVSIFISGSLIDKYITYFEGNNLENLKCIKDLIENEIVKEEIHKDINKSIYETGLRLSKNGEMTNLQILDFIKTIIDKNPQMDLAFEILSNLNIKNLDSKFYEEWKMMNWDERLKEAETYYISFIETVAGLINNLIDFEKLFKLFNISPNPEVIEINSLPLEKMRDKFIDLFNNYDYKDKNVDLKKLILSLIIYAKNEKKEAEKIIKFLKLIQEKLDEKLRNDLYLTILKEKGNSINEEIILFIIDFYVNDGELSAKALLDIILECSDVIKAKFLEKIKNLFINEDDFLEIENNERFILFKGLLDNGIILNENFQYIYFIESAIKKAKNLLEILKLKKGNIDWNKIYAFYNEKGEKEEKEKKEKAFSEKLLAICLNDENESSNIKSEYDQLISTIKKKSDSLKIILDDFAGFFGESQKENIDEIKKFIKNMSSGPVNYYEQNKDKIDELINKYEKESRERREKIKSSIFCNIYNDKKIKFKNSHEQSWINETEKDFKKLKVIFEDKGINSLDKNTLHICLKTIKEKDKEEMLKEFDILLELLKMKASQEKKEEVINNLSLLSKKEDIINIANAIYLFIANSHLIKGNLWNLVEEIQKNKEKLNNLENLMKYIDNLRENNIDIDILYDKNYHYDNYLNILLNLKEEPKAISFLLEKNEDDCKSLKEAAGGDDNALLSIQDIDDFRTCIIFIKKLGNRKKMNDCDFFKAFQENVKKTKDIQLYFNRYVNIYNELKKLFKNKFDKLATSKQKIIYICENSVFNLKNKKHSFFEGYYFDKSTNEGTENDEKDNGKIYIKISAIKELKDRASLTKKMSNDAEEKKNMEIFKIFRENVIVLFKIYDLIKEIYYCGYIEEIEVIITFNDYKTNFKGCGLDTSNPEEIIKCLTNINNDFKKKQLSAYRDRELIRYIYGRQINLIYDKIYKNKNNDILPLLKFISNNSKIKFDSIDYNVNEEKDIYFNIDCYLKYILKKNEIKIEDINEKDNTIEKKDGDNEFSGIYCFQALNIQKNVLQIYKYLTKSTPHAQYILFCNKETTSEELAAFLYRAFLCKRHSCFIIAGIELLSFKEKITLKSIFNEYANNEKKMKSCLVVVYMNTDADIVKYIHTLKKRFFRNILNELDNQNMDDINKKVEIIKSDKSGVGKSTHIITEIKKLRKKYVYFPFGGVFTRKDILKRLKDLNKIDDINNAVIHLDLYDTELIDLTMEFLFSLLITRIYGQNDDIFYLSEDIPIMVEIPNGFIDYMKKFPLLDIFKKTYLEIEHLAPLIISNEKNSNIQVVANYLQYLQDEKSKQFLNSHDIYFDGITPPYWIEFPSTIKADVISQEDCQKLIFDIINNKMQIKYPNYYQITSFINLLGSLLKKFSQNFLFSAGSLNEDRQNNYGSRDIRSYIIENYILFIQYFIDGGFINLINNQTRNFRQMSRNFDENRENEEAIQELDEVGKKENNLVSFDKLKNSFLLFQEKDGEGFEIISNEKNKEDYKRYTDILKSQKMGNENTNDDENNNDENDETKKQRAFLKRLKNILNINNDVGNSTKIEKLEKIKIDNGTGNKNLNKKSKENSKKNEKKKKRNKKENEEEEEEEDEEDNIDDEQDNENSPKKTLFDIADNYVFTNDNYFKLALILLRIRAQIPVIMMGETGCGKTSLIRILSEMLNNGDKKKMKILNIHAGTNDSDIIRFLKKKVIPEAKKLQEKEREKRENYIKNGFIFYETKLWVFLDEINTCKSMGLISEILCKRTFQGNPLPTNISFIAACNPYRIDPKKIKKRNGLDAANAQNQIENNLKDQKEIDKVKNSSNQSSLVYTVNPLPHSLLNFVFDFGRVKEDDEKEYIINIIEQSQRKYFNTYQSARFNKKDFKKIFELAVELIVESQDFIRKKNDVSSVSLREIRRFNIFFEYFYEYLSKKKEMKIEEQTEISISELEKENYNFYSKLEYKDIHIYSIILSIFVCYYLRIPENEVRKELNNKLKVILEKYDKNYKEFLEIPLKEENFVAESIDLEKGIAKNKALLDNIFALFVTINTKVPIFIVGKPGCSKSLSVQLINKSMRGDASKKLLFKNLPEIIMSCYQGSMGSTSKGVKSVFQRARNILKNVKKQRNNLKDNEINEKKIQEVISMIYFDEMGLAEHSPNNPLKVIHSELEYDLNEGDKKVAFVGISNWALDASKMNRGLFLSIPDPEREDAKYTSYTIGESYDSTLANTYKSVYESLGDIYYDYKHYLLEQFSNGLEEFHGNRDFYHMAKNVARNIVKENTNALSQNQKNFIIKKSIERNFAGLVFENSKETSLKRIKKYYRYFDDNVEIEDRYDVKDIIGQNIEDLKSRYLLVISKPSISEFLLTSILKEKNKEYNYYKGSPYEEDKKSEEYILKMLNKIQLNMEQEKVLILNNLESVYPALYDLFNQNFNQIGKKNFARIALGYTTNAYSLVNDKFRCIVNVDDDKIKKEEPPFLNRFEKHIISFENLLNEKYLNKSKEIYNILLELTQNNDPENAFLGINYNLKEIFINLDKEEINAYIYKNYKNDDLNQKDELANLNELTDKVIEKLSLLLPQDIIIYKKYSGFDKKYPRIAEKIIEEYNKGEHNNFASFLKKMKDMKNVIYTFSDIFSHIKNISNIDNDILGKIEEDNITTIEINSFTTENKFEDKLNDSFFNDNNKKLCIIKFQSKERHFLNYVKFMIENKEKEMNNNDNEKIKKAFVFIVYLDRTFNNNQDSNAIENDGGNKNNETISLTSEFYQIFIDDLNGSDNNTINDILTLSRGGIIKKWINYNDIIKYRIYETFYYMDYNILCDYKKITKKNYSKKIADVLEKNEKIKGKIHELIAKQMEKDENLISNSFKKKDLVTIYDIDFISCIQFYLSEKYAQYFNEFYYKAEKDQFFSTLISIEALKKEEKDGNLINIQDEDEEKNVKVEEDKEKDNKGNKYHEDMVKKLIDIYFQKLNLEKEKTNQKEMGEENQKNMNIIEEYGANKVDIILGFELPGIFPIISSIVKRSRQDIIKKYLINESNLRKFIAEEDIINEKKEYEKKLKDLNNILFIDLDKNENIKSIIMENDIIKNEFAVSFLEDYYNIFIYNNLVNYIKPEENNNKKYKFDLSELKNVLKLIVKYNENINHDLDLESIVSIINWIETYSIEIAYILKIYIMLRKYIDNIYSSMEKTLKEGLINYGDNEKCQEYTSVVNKALFNGFEAILKIITSSIELYTKREKKEEIDKLLNMNKEILNQMNKFNLNLKLFSKEILTLQEIIEIIDLLNINGKCTKENLETIIKYFSEDLDENNLVENFDKFNKYLEQIFDKNNSYYKLISIVFKNEFAKNNNNIDFKNKITAIITSKNEYILSNSQLLKIILEFDTSPDKIGNNLDTILKDQNILQIINNNCNNEFLEQNILNIYDFLFMKYFTKTRNIIEGYIKSRTNDEIVEKYKKLSEALKKKDKKDNYDDTGMVFGLSLDIFGECVKFLDNLSNNNDKNNNLAKLYCISYIKAYLNQLVNFSLYNFQNIGNIQEIINIITEKENNFRKVMKIYVIKLFFNSDTVKKDYQVFNNFNFDNYEYKFIIDLLKNEKEKDIIKEIYEEKLSPTNEKYNEYPLLKYFIYSIDKQKEKKIFIEQFEADKNNINKYPIIYKFIEENKEENKNKNTKLKNLNNLEKYNGFCNFMVDHYSFKLTREEANNKKFKEESIYKQITKASKKNIFKDFLDCWKGINKYPLQYKSNKLNKREIDEDKDTLAYFLNDVNEVGKGMYIAAGYEFYIKTQNDFLNYILEHGKDKPYLKFYFENIKNKIPVYEANNNQILLIYSAFKSSEYSSFTELINDFTKRKIYNNDGSIDYLNYNKFEFDFQGIEEELAKSILPGKCLFEDENNLNFVNYWGEGFNGGKEDFLQRFEKVLKEPEELTKDEKIKILENIKNNIDDYKLIYGYVQLLIFYLTDNYQKDEDIIKMIENSPENVQTKDENLKAVFQGFKVNKIYSIFLFIEKLCFNLFSQNLLKEYKKDIDDNSKNKITDIVKNKKDAIKGLAAAVRRFISRFLYRIKDENELLSNAKLFIELKKKLSLWDKQYRDEKKINDILALLEEFNLTIGQSFNLYQLIKEEEEDEFNDFDPQRNENGIINNEQPLNNNNNLNEANAKGVIKKKKKLKQ